MSEIRKKNIKKIATMIAINHKTKQPQDAVHTYVQIVVSRDQ
jgi:hypothetical protein